MPLNLEDRKRDIYKVKKKTNWIKKSEESWNRKLERKDIIKKYLE